MLEPMTTDANPTLNLRVIIFTCIGLALIGAVTSSLGPLLSTIRERFGVRDSDLGWLAAVQFAGAILGNLSFVVLARVPAGWRMAGGMVTFGLGVLGFALTNVWLLALLGLFVAGLGFGVFQANYANIFANGLGPRSGAILTLMGGTFSLGAMVGPAVVGLLLARGQGYGILFVVCAFLACLLPFGLHRIRKTAFDPKAGSPRATNHVLLAGFIALSVFYVAAESNAALWAASHLTDGLGFTKENAAFLTSYFWVAITAGRFLSVPIALRISSANLIVAAMALSLIGLLMAQVPAVAPYGYLLAGLAFAPVFPSGMAWMGRAVPGEFSTSSYFLAGTVGSLLSAPLVGLVKEQFGANAIPSILLAFALIALGCAIWLRQATAQTRKLEA
jgi:MFS transporter, FHS family, glucose/mannose:H+ symporter